MNRPDNYHNLTATLGIRFIMFSSNHSSTFLGLEAPDLLSSSLEDVSIGFRSFIDSWQGIISNVYGIPFSRHLLTTLTVTH